MLCQKKKSINNWLVDTDPPALLILEQKTSDTHSLDGFSFCGWAFHKPDKLGICPKNFPGHYEKLLKVKSLSPA